MNNRIRWIKTRQRTGGALLVAGILVISLGIFSELQFPQSLYNLRLITGLGILLAGGGAGMLVRYGAALRDEQAARRLVIEERDERTVLIRTRAGNRAYWASAFLFYIGLMWASFASSRGLPPLAGDTLWIFLAIGVLVPFAVYMASTLLDQRNL